MKGKLSRDESGASTELGYIFTKHQRFTVILNPFVTDLASNTKTHTF